MIFHKDQINEALMIKVPMKSRAKFLRYVQIKDQKYLWFNEKSMLNLQTNEIIQLNTTSLEIQPMFHDLVPYYFDGDETRIAAVGLPDGLQFYKLMHDSMSLHLIHSDSHIYQGFDIKSIELLQQSIIILAF